MNTRSFSLKPCLLAAAILCCILLASGNAPAGAKKSARIPDSPLTIGTMFATTYVYLPDREWMNTEDKQELFSTLQTLGMATFKEFALLFDTYLKPALKDEKRICREIIGNNGCSEDGYVAEEEDMPAVRRGVYFTQIGLIRSMLFLKYGEEYEDIIRTSHEIYYDEGCACEQCACEKCECGTCAEKSGDCHCGQCECNGCECGTRTGKHDGCACEECKCGECACEECHCDDCECGSYGCLCGEDQ